ncbi:MAG: glycosyltransferase [Phycisphaerae bacterium]|nr:glycosyltransferase [Phycisphaerae bacterium]MDD5381706.1 glycosyltransferase [Phycisphaerae bacterium]
MSFANFLKAFLENKGVTVINHLDDDDIDIILHVNITFTSAYSFYAAYLYKLDHPDTIIVHRMNDSGMHRSNALMSRSMITCCGYSDYLVYISEWLQNLMQPKSSAAKPSIVIYNGADAAIFNQSHHKEWDKKSKLKIVTHHWSSNYLKGHEIYKHLDELLDEKPFQEKYEFTYIGNYPKGLQYKNTQLIPPLNKLELAAALKKHDVYLTGARDEAAGMHHIEAALCGLPILYVNSGGIPEYCREYGIEVSKENLRQALLQIYRDYDRYYNKMKSYANTASAMSENYLKLFEELIPRRKEFSEHAVTLKHTPFYNLYRGCLRLKDKLYSLCLRRGSLISRILMFSLR